MKRSATTAELENPPLEKHSRHPVTPRNTDTSLLYYYFQSAVNSGKSHLFKWFNPQRSAPTSLPESPILEPTTIPEAVPPIPTKKVDQLTIIDLTISNDNEPRLLCPDFDNYKSDRDYLLSIDEEQTWINKLSQDSDIKVSHAQQLLDLLVKLKRSQTNPPLDFRVQDSIINKFFKTLSAQYTDVYCIDGSLILSTLFEKFKKRPKYLGDLKENANKIQTVLWPISNGEPGKPTVTDHWFLVILNKIPNGKYNIFCLDGLNSPSRSKFLEKAKELLSVLHPGKDLNELVNEATIISIPTQANDVDCGVVVCYWALQFLNGCDYFKSITKNPVHYTPFRLQIAKIITHEESPKIIHKLK